MCIKVVVFVINYFTVLESKVFLMKIIVIFCRCTVLLKILILVSSHFSEKVDYLANLKDNNAMIC